jgi:L-cysteine/cystine lyase
VNLDGIRSELPVLERLSYLNTGTFGPLPRRTTEVMVAEQMAELEHGRSGASYWERGRALRRRVREAIAGLVGSAPEDLALTRSTTDGCNVVVAGLCLGPDDEVVTTDSEHFGLLGALAVSGARIRVARIRDLPADQAAAAVLAECSPRTRLIAISHVVWTTGQVMAVRELAESNIPVLVDGAQGAGAVPVDVRELGCDFYTVSGQKWLLGPDGTGAVYVAPDRVDELKIALPSYFSQQAHEPNGAFEETEGAPRFDVGTVPVPTLAGLEQSIEFARRAGPDRFQRARSMAERCRELLAEKVEVVTEPGQSTLVAFRPPGDPAGAVERLAAQGVVVRDMPGLGWVRASIGFWTSEEDILRLVDGL